MCRPCTVPGSLAAHPPGVGIPSFASHTNDTIFNASRAIAIAAPSHTLRVSSSRIATAAELTALPGLDQFHVQMRRSTR